MALHLSNGHGFRAVLRFCVASPLLTLLFSFSGVLSCEVSQVLVALD